MSLFTPEELAEVARLQRQIEADGAAAQVLITARAAELVAGAADVDLTEARRVLDRVRAALPYAIVAVETIPGLPAELRAVVDFVARLVR